MRLIFGGVVVLAGGLALSAAPFLAKRIPAIQWELVPRSSSHFTTQGQTNGQGPATGSTPAAAEKGAHMDHKSKHGGTFFMALDNKHHLEGILVPPGTFRVYL